jgi:hypothetical protein
VYGGADLAVPVGWERAASGAAVPLAAHPGPTLLPRGGLPCLTRLASEPGQIPVTS